MSISENQKLRDAAEGADLHNSSSELCGGRRRTISYQMEKQRET